MNPYISAPKNLLYFSLFVTPLKFFMLIKNSRSAVSALPWRSRWKRHCGLPYSKRQAQRCCTHRGGLTGTFPGASWQVLSGYFHKPLTWAGFPDRKMPDRLDPSAHLKVWALCHQIAGRPKKRWFPAIWMPFYTGRAVRAGSQWMHMWERMRLYPVCTG